MWSFSHTTVAAVTLVLAACGFAPIYSGGGGANIQSGLASIEIEPISDRVGQRLHNHLLDGLNPYGRPRKPLFVLQVRLSEFKQELAVRKTELATRANLGFRAAFSLFHRDDRSSSVFSGSSRVVSSYNILNSDYATLIAERDARERAVRELSTEIINRLAAFITLQDPG